MRACGLLLLAGCAPDLVPPEWADVVVSAPGASDRPYGDPSLAANGARGGTWTSGSTDVYSLVPGTGDALVLAWSAGAVVDGPGPDLVVFENAFAVTDDARFMDPCVVAVSADGVGFAAFPHAYAGGTEWSADPSDWTGFAGITPTLLDEEANPVDPFDPVPAGGDAFDLADLPPGPVADAIATDGVAAVRITPASDEDDPATGAPYPHDPIANGPDVDAVYARRWPDGP